MCDFMFFLSPKVRVCLSCSLGLASMFSTTGLCVARGGGNQVDGAGLLIINLFSSFTLQVRKSTPAELRGLST